MRLKTDATLRTLREKLRPRPRLVCLLKLVALWVGGGLKRAGVTVAALSDLPITRTGSSAAVMVFRRRWPTELLEEAEVEAELVLVLVLEEVEAHVDVEVAVLTEEARDGAGLG